MRYTNLARSVEDFRDFIAQQIAELACTPAARGRFDQASPDCIGGTRHSSHGMIIHDGDDCSKITVPTQRTVVRETYSDGTLFSFGELRIRNKCKSHPESDARGADRVVCNGVCNIFLTDTGLRFAIRAGDYQPTRERRVHSGSGPQGIRAPRYGFERKLRMVLL